MKHRFRITIKGIVQGIGFRPYIYNLAKDNNLYGYIFNNSSGVEIDIENKRISQLTEFKGDVQIRQPSFSPDGKWIAFVLSDTTAQRDIAAISLNSDKFIKITNDDYDDRNPCWSPGG